MAYRKTTGPVTTNSKCNNGRYRSKNAKTATYRSYYYCVYSKDFPDENRRYDIETVANVLMQCFYYIAIEVIYNLFIFRPPYRWGEFKVKEINQNHVSIMSRHRKRVGVKKRLRSHHSFHKTFSLKWAHYNVRIANFKNRIFFKFVLYNSLCPTSDSRFKDVGNQGLLELIKSKANDPEQRNYSAY